MIAPLLLLLIPSFLTHAPVPGLHDGVLARHATVERALEFGTKRQFVQVGGFLLGQDDALLRERLVLHAR